MDGMTRRELEFSPIEVKCDSSIIAEMDNGMPLTEERTIRAYVVSFQVSKQVHLSLILRMKSQIYLIFRRVYFNEHRLEDETSCVRGRKTSPPWWCFSQTTPAGKTRLRAFLLMKLHSIIRFVSFLLTLLPHFSKNIFIFHFCFYLAVNVSSVIISHSMGYISFIAIHRW